MYQSFGKRLFDIVLSLLAIVTLLPVIGVVWIVVLVNFGRPAIFRQARGGFRCAPFDILKFRTMTNARGADGQLLSDEERLTSVGLRLRELSLDELPGLINVLRGEMSLVGPRPFLFEYMSLYTDDQRRRHDVRPGITGWAQVNGRNSLTWEEKFELDLWYADRVSLGLDLKILLMTVRKVLRRDSISAEGYATVPLFSTLTSARSTETPSDDATTT